MKKSILKKVSLLLMMMVFALGSILQAAEIDTKNMILVRIKATVPEGFNSNVTLRYIGKNTNETLEVILNQEKNYTAVVNVQKDVYTYKYSDAGEHYAMSYPEAFTLENATDGNTYWLPVTVNAKATTIESNKNAVNVKVVADVSCGYVGAISLKYSGTEENTLEAILNEKNGYQTEVVVSNDIYTLENIQVDQGYICDAKYSFSLAGANESNSYVLNLKVKDENAVEEINAPVAESTSQTQPVNIRLTGAEQAGITGKVYVVYTGKTGEMLEAELSAANGYSQVVQVTKDTYEILYCNYYDDTTLVLEPTMNTLVVDGSSQISVNIKVMDQNGTVLNNENESKNNNVQQTNQGPKKDYSKYIFYGVIVVIGIGYYLFQTKGKGGKKKGKGGKKKQEEYEEDDFEDEELDENE